MFKLLGATLKAELYLFKTTGQRMMFARGKFKRDN